MTTAGVILLLAGLVLTGALALQLDRDYPDRSQPPLSAGWQAGGTWRVFYLVSFTVTIYGGAVLAHQLEREASIPQTVSGPVTVALWLLSAYLPRIVVDRRASHHGAQPFGPTRETGTRKRRSRASRVPPAH